MKPGLVVGAIVGLILSVVGSSAALFGYTQWSAHRLSRGWVIVKALETTRPMKRGEVFDRASLGVREVPEQLFTASAISPADGERVEARRASADLPAHTMLRWTDVDTDPPDPLRACLAR